MFYLVSAVLYFFVRIALYKIKRFCHIPNACKWCSGKRIRPRGRSKRGRKVKAGLMANFLTQTVTAW